MLVIATKKILKDSTRILKTLGDFILFLKQDKGIKDKLIFLENIPNVIHLWIGFTYRR